MRVNELMIGNWIQSKHKETWNEWKVLPDDIEQIFSNEHLVDAYRGIPITTEWLEKFGFERDKNGYYYLNVLVADCYQGSFNWISVQSRYISDFDHTVKHIQHIHQLQNLYFALTGEELNLQS